MRLTSADEVQNVQRSLETDGYAVIPNVVSKSRLQELGATLTAEYERFRGLTTSCSRAVAPSAGT